GEKSRFIDNFINRIASRYGEEPEIYKYYPFDTEIISVISLLRNRSLFSKYKIIILNFIEEIKNKDDITLLAEYIKHPGHQTTLFLLSDGTTADKRIEKLISAENRKIFWELFDNQKLSWLIGYFNKEGITLEQEAANLFLEIVQNDTQDMKRECEKLSVFFGPRSVITEESIETYIYHSREENVFTLFDRLAGLNLDAALQILQKIMLSGDSNPTQILGGLLWQFKKLLALKNLLEANYNPQEACLKLDIKSKRNQKIYLLGKDNYSIPDLQGIIVLISHYDTLLRSVRSDMHSLLLTLFIYYCIRKRRPAVDIFSEY
ncbi:MAG: DNA polymerase III subunit delta, partial [Spirochaetota bacterium]